MQRIHKIQHFRTFESDFVSFSFLLVVILWESEAGGFFAEKAAGVEDILAIAGSRSRTRASYLQAEA